METFQDYAYYYNLFYGDKNYKKEAESIYILLNKYTSKKINNILNIGCGTGRHDVELARLGYTMHGIDISENMISIANKNLPSDLQSKISYEIGDAKQYDTEIMYDAVISLFHVISYQNENRDVIDFMKTAGKCLNSGALFLFDLWYGPGVLSDKPSVRIREVGDERNHVIRLAQPVNHILNNTVDVNYNVLVIDKETSAVSELRETHSMRYFFTPEVRYYLDNSGFELIDCIDCETLGDVTFDSWTAYFIARKK